MKNNITKDIEHMKYILGYKRGVVISEQPIKKTSLSEQQSTEGCIDGDCDNRKGTYKYSSGSEYTGEWKDGLFNGQGTFTKKNGSAWSGEFKNNELFNGKITYKSSNGDNEYIEVIDGVKGEKKNDNPAEQNNNKEESKTGCVTGNCEDGDGTYKYSSGAVYAGGWKEDEWNGKGVYKSADGTTEQTGEFKNNKLYNGYKIFSDFYCKVINGDDGDIINGKPPEQVQSTSGDGNSPEKNNNEKSSSGCSGNCKDGIGTFRYTDKDEYTGQWKDSKRNGQGTDTTLGDDNSIVNVETGEWKDNSLFNGYITYIFDDGTGVYYEVINGKQGDRKNGKPPVLNKTPVLNNNQEQSKTGDEVKDGVQDELKNGELPKQDNATIDPNNATAQNNSGDCVQPTKPTHRYKNDKNYQYAKSGDCWWAKNITNNKWFNLTELVKTKPKVQSSIDKLNNGTDLIKL